VESGEVKGFASGVDMDAHLYANPSTVLAAVEFFKEDANTYAYSVQTNGTARWFKGKYFSADEYVQLPVVVAVQRAVARFLDGKGMEIGVKLVDSSISGVSETFDETNYAGGALQGGDGGVGGGVTRVPQLDLLLPLFYMSSCMLILMMQVHDTVDKRGVFDLLAVHSLSRTAHFLVLVATWSSIQFWNSLAFVGAYALLYISQSSLTWYEVSLMISCGQAMMALGLIVGALLRHKGSVLGVGFLLFFWSWMSIVSGFADMYTEYVTPWGLLVFGLRGQGGWATQALMWLLSWGFMLLAWVASARTWTRFGRWNDTSSMLLDAGIIKLDHLRKRYGATLALDDASLLLEPGQEKVILGTCSAGKSTLLKSIIDEQCPYVRRAPGLLIGYCPQEPTFFDYMTVAEWLGLIRAIRGLDVEEGECYLADEDDGDVKLKSATMPILQDHRIISDLNRGERRWLSLQTAMVGMSASTRGHRDGLVLLDEPTVEMSPKLKRLAWGLIQEIKQAGCGVLVATHDVEEAERGDEIIVLSRGVTVFTGTELELRRRFGCGYQLNIRVSPAMLVTGAVHNLVTRTLGSKTANKTSSDGYCTFDVPHEMEDRLPRLLTTLDMNRSVLGVEDVQLRSATVFNSFMSLIRQVELEAAVREGRYELLLVAEEQIALKIPIGSDLVESPSGILYQLVWSTDPSNGRLTISSYSMVPAD
jgi:ABC-type multidrug transport system ATPase subunit